MSSNTGTVKRFEIHEHNITKVYNKPTPQIPKDGKEFLSRFKSNFKFRVLEQSEDKNHIVFEIIGIDVSLANALRRIMIAEVPTVAIEHVYMWNNTSIMHDEVLAHRIGLIPIHIDPRMFESFEEDDDATDKNTLVFRLAVTCNSDSMKEGNNSKLNPSAAPNTPYTLNVYSKDLEWVPQGNQQERCKNGVKPVFDDILLMQLRPGQSIELEAHARKSVGKDHAKYSPVSTASYRLMPRIELVKEVYDELADELDTVEPGVFNVVPCNEKGYSRKALVVNPYACTMSRNFMRSPKLKEAIRLTRVADHFIFSVESVGMLPASTIVAEAIRILRDKTDRLVGFCHELKEKEGA